MKHFYTKINSENWFGYQSLYSTMVDKFPSGSHFVEVGVWKGMSTVFMAVEIINSGKQIKFDCVDTWRYLKTQRDIPEESFKGLYDIFLQNIAPVKNNINIVRDVSWKAAKKYEDKSLDFIFIDGAHDYDSVMRDISAWYPKLKIGGIIAGHDYFSRGVKDAVHDYFKTNDIQSPTVSCWLIEKKDSDPLMIYDLFIFYNELDLLEIRLNLLHNHVDKFILVEATTTFSGKPKPLYYQQNKKRYTQFNDKIIPIVVDDLPKNSKDRWPAEAAQRLAFRRGLTAAQDSDIVIMSDADEIWRPEALPEQVTAPRVFLQKAKGFFLNAKNDRKWCGSVVVSYGEFKKEHPDLLRRRRRRLKQINNGGWHWSYLGGKAFIREKLEAFAHASLDNEPSKLSWIEAAKRQKENCYLPPESDPDWPTWLKDNWRKYSHLVIEK